MQEVLFVLEEVLFLLSKDLPKNAQIHSHNTSYAGNFNLPSHYTRLFEKKPTYSGAKFFNVSPEELKKLEQTEMKSSLTIWLSVRSFYMTAEFLNWKHFELEDL